MSERASPAPTWDSVADILSGTRTGKKVRLRGWVHRQRSAGKMAFVVLRDGSGTVQCTVKGGVADADSLEAAKQALIESSVSLLEGEVVEDERAPGGFEVRASRFQLHQRAADFPLRGEQGTEFELDNRHLWLRSTELSAVFRVKHRLLAAARAFFDAEGFVETDPSVITTNACEGGSTLFTFDYFGRTAYLSQSAQMYLEGLIFGTPKVYSVTNSFRAEKSRTSKHLTEFHHLEAEYAWWGHEENLSFQERLVEHVAHEVARTCDDDLRLLGHDPERLAAVKAPFVRITYHEAAKRLRDLGYEFPDDEDFGAPHELALGEEDDLTQGGTSPFFVTHWPAAIKAFYMRQDPDDADRVLCADLIAPAGYGELIGGSERSEDIAWMEAQLWSQFQHDVGAGDLPAGVTQEMVDADPRAAFEDKVLPAYAWYFDLRRYGSVPHSGFGLGVERLLRWFTGQEHIRDMLPYPRTPSRAYP